MVRIIVKKQYQCEKCYNTFDAYEPAEQHENRCNYKKENEKNGSKNL